MKSISTIAALAGALMLSSAAYADDVNWSGLYLGIHAGHAWSDFDASLVHPFPAVPGGVMSDGGSMSADSWLGGGHIGGNIQSGNFVYGIEADVSRADMSASEDFRMDFDTDWATRIKLDTFGTVRGRIGYTTGPMMIYATAGFAWGQSQMDIDTISITGPVVMSQLSKSKTHLGWTAGLGAEWALGPNISVRGEWLYTDLGSESYDPSGLAYAGTPAEFKHQEKASADLDFHMARVGVSYRFDFTR